MPLSLFPASKFQSTHPRGVRLATTTTNNERDYFNPRTHVGCDLIREAIKIRSGDFNPRTHVGCDGDQLVCHSGIVDFNPRTHVGCDDKLDGLMLDVAISIHAPTWGATPELTCTQWQACISIHAPTWGATHAAVHYDLCGKFQSTHPRGVRQVLSYQREAFGLFQSTHPRGVRRMMFAQRMWGNGISIHAPTWGATSDHDSDGNDDSISIHAPTWGAT